MYTYVLHLCIVFQTLDDGETIDLSVENMWFLIILRATRMRTLLPLEYHQRTLLFQIM